MFESIRRKLRRSTFTQTLYQTFYKPVVTFPLYFTPLRSLRKNFPLKDIFHPRKLFLFAAVVPYTQAGYPRLSNVFDLATAVERQNLLGAFVECGTWKGGCAAIMGAIAKRYGERRKTYYIDSFEGMPPSSEKDGPNPQRILGDKLKASMEEVKELIFGKLNLNPAKNIFVKGWFDESLPRVKKDIGSIAILRLDADWYSSTMTVLNELYDQVVSGGYVIFDDYGTWPGCREAVHEFMEKRKIKVPLQFIGTHDPEAFKKMPPAFFRKP